MNLIVLDENLPDLPNYWPAVDNVLRQIGGSVDLVGPSEWAGCDLSDAVVVALGKKMADLAVGGKLGPFNEVVGNQFIAKDESGREATLIAQYHPAFVLRQMDEKGGGSEKALSLWYDIWDSVQSTLLGLDEDPPEIVQLTNPIDILLVLNHVVTSDQVIRRAYDYETWGDVDALRPELNRQFRVLSIGLAWSERHDDGVRRAAVAFPLDRDMGDTAQKVIAKSWLKVIDVGATAHSAQYEHKCNHTRFGRSGHLRDTQLMDNAIDELQRHSLERVMIRCRIPWAGYKRRNKDTQKNPANADLHTLLQYNGLDALATLICDETLQERIDGEDQLEGVARADELFTASLARVEMAGMKVDLAEAASYRVKAREELKKLDAEFKRLPEVKKVEKWAMTAIKTFKKNPVFNPKSPPQMRRLLLHEVRLPIRPQRDGSYKLDKRAIAPFVEQFPVVGQLNKVRSLSSMISGFLDKWESFVGPDGNAHSRYRLAEVVTGRLSSSDPPQQNMPRSTEVRRAIISRFRGGSLIEGDAVQQEPRLIAGWSQDERMIEAINDGLDLHGFVASEIFGVPYEGKNTKHREEFGKGMNLGIIYGQTEYGLSMKTGITTERALELLAQHRQLFPDMYAWIESKHDEAIQLGYVTDLFGARRHLPAAQSTDEWKVKRALRQAGNFPIQSTANRFTLFSLAVLHAAIDREGWNDQIVPCGTVHDSIISDSAPGYERRTADLLEYAFTWHNDQSHWKDRGVKMATETKIGANLKDTTAPTWN